MGVRRVLFRSVVRKDVLAAAEDDEFLLPPLEEKEAVGIEAAEVADAEPAVLGEGLAVGHRVVAVAGEDVRAAKLDLAHAGRAGHGDPQLAALVRLALAADALERSEGHTSEIQALMRIS